MTSLVTTKTKTMEKEVKTYIVVKSDNLNELIESVNQLIKTGWVCQGGMACDAYRNYQAMVKYKE